MAKAAESKLLRINRIRADTTVVPANVAYPTDSGLLAKAIRRIAATGKRIQAAGGAVRTTLRDRSRAAGKRAHAIAAQLRAALRPAATRRRPPCAGSLASWSSWPPPLPPRPKRLLATAKQALRRAKAKTDKLRERGIHDAAAGAAARAADPRGQRPDRAARGDAADRGTHPSAPGLYGDRYHARRRSGNGL